MQGHSLHQRNQLHGTCQASPPQDTFSPCHCFSLSCGLCRCSGSLNHLRCLCTSSWMQHWVHTPSLAPTVLSWGKLPYTHQQETQSITILWVRKLRLRKVQACPGPTGWKGQSPDCLGFVCPGAGKLTTAQRSSACFPHPSHSSCSQREGPSLAPFLLLSPCPHPAPQPE